MELLLFLLFTLLVSVMPILFIFQKLKKMFCKKCRNHFSSAPFTFTLVTNKNDLSEFIRKILTKKYNLIGLDIEYYQGYQYKGRVCLLQISLPNKETYVIDIITIGNDKSVKESLQNILENPEIEKVIHACENDIKWIKQEFSIIIENVFDTQEASKQIEKSKNGESLDKVLKKYNLYEMDRDKKKFFQKSNWEIRPLTEEQLIYSAQDSYFLIDLRNILANRLGESLPIFLEKSNKSIRQKLYETHDQILHRKAHNYFIGLCVKLDPLINEICKEVFQNLYKYNDCLSKELDINPENLLNKKVLFKISTKLPENVIKLKEIIKQERVKYNPITHDEMIGKIIEMIDKIKNEKGKLLNEQEKSKLESISNPSSKKPLKKTNLNKGDLNYNLESNPLSKKTVYESYKMLAPDGKLICYVDSKKMKWYLDKQIAVTVEEDKFAFRLKFAPGGGGCSELAGIKSDYSKDRKNCCVVCGDEKEFIKFHVVPSLYRTFFKKEMKEHKSHDVLLLCNICTVRANKLYDVNIKRIAEKYNVPLIVLSESQREIKRLEGVIIAAKRIHNSFEMPVSKKQEIGEELMEFINKSEENIKKFPFFFKEIFSNEEFPKKITEFSKEMLRKISKYKIKEETSEDKRNYHGKLIVDKITDFNEFIRGWRLYFIEIMDPQYLPEAWKVDHQHYLNYGEHTKIDSENIKEGRIIKEEIK
jgi:ribonuclease D